jgi:4-hydroxyphenylpyruvate dioxygenase
MEIRLQPEPTGLKYIDHMVGNVGWNEWIRGVSRRGNGVCKFPFFDDEANHTEYSALMSKVMSMEMGVLSFPINEPAEG